MFRLQGDGSRARCSAEIIGAKRTSLESVPSSFDLTMSKEALLSDVWSEYL